MGLFWRRKKEDRYITLGLNQPATVSADEKTDKGEPPAHAQPSSAESQPENITSASTIIESVAAGDAPTPTPIQKDATGALAADSVVETIRPASPSTNIQASTTTSQSETARNNEPQRKPSPSQTSARSAPSQRSAFSSSILGLDRSIEELEAEIVAQEQTYAVRFSRAISATRESLSEKIDAVFQGRKVIDAELLDELEEALIAADIGVPTTLAILDTVRRGISRKEISDIDALKAAIKNELLTILKHSEAQGVASEESVPEAVAPYVIMVVGVNGVGKTTTIGKLAQRIKAEGNDVLICAADTFRAAASDQLAIWAERTGVPLIQQKHGTDPAAVLFDALKAAKARSSDVLIVDTAGRLHNKSNLMAELEKMKRIAGREVEGAPHETLLVVDAVTGQNGLEQARQFLKVAGVTGIVLTKLDGTAKGGIAVAISKELNLPIRYAGIGEKVDDLVIFDAEQYVNSLFT